MWIYIVTWIVGTLISDPCPMPSFSQNDYGLEYREIIPSCGVKHYHWAWVEKEKQFEKREDAVYFISTGEKYETNFTSYNFQHLDEFKLDSLYVPNDVCGYGCKDWATHVNHRKSLWDKIKEIYNGN